MGNIFAERIEALRALMTENGWDAVVITGSDPHSSEYPAPRWKQVEWLTGFTGEAGDVVITADHAGLWTDSRYFIQALDQLQGSGVELHKTRVPDAVPIPQWLSSQARVVAVDGLCQSVSAVQELERALGEGAVVVDAGSPSGTLGRQASDTCDPGDHPGCRVLRWGPESGQDILAQEMDAPTRV